MKGLLVILFAIAFGFTASGIVASLYRLLAPSSGSDSSWLRNGVLIIAGPTVFFGAVTRAYIKNELSASLVVMTFLALSYWSFAIGLFILNLAIAFK
jgi:hypothetical protein